MNIDLILVRASIAFSVITMLLILGGIVAGSLLAILVGVGFFFACGACVLLSLQNELATGKV